MRTRPRREFVGLNVSIASDELCFLREENPSPPATELQYPKICELEISAGTIRFRLVCAIPPVGTAEPVPVVEYLVSSAFITR